MHLSFPAAVHNGTAFGNVGLQIRDGKEPPAHVVMTNVWLTYAGWATQQSFLLSDITETAAAPSPTRSVAKLPPRNKLKRDIDLLEQMIQSNALTLKSKRLNDDDQEALARQMAIRMAHQKLLQQRLDRLST